jgi:dTDP-glucose pyrophosphorylase
MDILINKTSSVSTALKSLDRSAEKILFVVDAYNKFLGTITDGDIRRFLISNGNLDTEIKDLYNTKSTFFFEDEFDVDNVKNIMISKGIEVIPILNRKFTIIDYKTWKDLFNDQPVNKKNKGSIDVPVVIMAGGKGTRLEPFTKILPKPLIPVNDKPILKHIIDEFRQFKAKNFLLILNYKGEIIKAFMKEGTHDYNISYIWEEEFYGTAGSLNLLGDAIENDFILSNCDILVKADYSDVLKFHRKNNADMTILSAVKHYKIPYGVIERNADGCVKRINEKPENTFFVNTGVYLLNKRILGLIPENVKYDMDIFIKDLLNKDFKIQTYPVNENDYVDIGQWEEYKIAINKIKNFI